MTKPWLRLGRTFKVLETQTKMQLKKVQSQLHQEILLKRKKMRSLWKIYQTITTCLNNNYSSIRMTRSPASMYLLAQTSWWVIYPTKIFQKTNSKSNKPTRRIIKSERSHFKNSLKRMSFRKVCSEVRFWNTGKPTKRHMSITSIVVSSILNRCSSTVQLLKVESRLSQERLLQILTGS